MTKVGEKPAVSARWLDSKERLRDATYERAARVKFLYHPGGPDRSRSCSMMTTRPSSGACTAEAPASDCNEMASDLYGLSVLCVSASLEKLASSSFRV